MVGDRFSFMLKLVRMTSSFDFVTNLTSEKQNWREMMNYSSGHHRQLW